MRSFFSNALALVPEIVGRLMSRAENKPIESLDELYAYVGTRAAFVAQKTLYGYLKTRMGTRYPSMFEDDVFVESINIAKFEVFAACLSDLAIYAVARATEGAEIPTGVRKKAALECYALAIAENAGDGLDAEKIRLWTKAFEERLDRTLWAGAALANDNFSESPQALYDWAPIAPQLKHYDEEIVKNSIRFAWHEVRIQLMRRLDREAIIRELADNGAD